MLSINHQVQLKKRQPVKNSNLEDNGEEKANQNNPVDSNVKIFGKFEFMAKEKKVKRRTTKKTKVQDENELLLAAADVSNVTASNVNHYSIIFNHFRIPSKAIFLD